jgi:hypothetical protein
VRRNPVEDDSKAVGVKTVHELPQVVRGAVARGGGEVAGDLIAPGPAERVGHHRQQLDVGEAHVGRICRELVGELQVGERTVALERVQSPRAEVHLIYRHRPAERLSSPALVEPRVVALAPAVARARDDRSGLGWMLRLLGVRIGLQQQLVLRRDDLELVAGPGVDAGQEQLPDAARSQ